MTLYNKMQTLEAKQGEAYFELFDRLMLGGMDIEDAIEECWKYFEGESEDRLCLLI